MMTLYEAARVFDSFVFEDAYSSSVKFSGQLLPFADSRNSSPSARRRILETSPSTSIPTKRTIKETTSGDIFIVAGGAVDLFRNAAIRVKRAITPTHGSFNIGYAGNILSNTYSLDSLYLDINYIKRVVEEDKSFYEGGYELIFSSYYSITRGMIVNNGTKYYQALGDSRVENSGFGVVEAVEITSPTATATILTQGTTYNPTTDTYNSTTYSSVPIFIVRGILDFEHEAMGAVDVEAGDKTISVLKSSAATLSVGSTIGSYKVLSMTDHSTYWDCHARKI